MDRWLARLGYAIRRHGPVGLIWLIGYNLAYPILRKGSKNARTQHDAFDEKYGTDTGGIREIGSLDVVGSPAARYALRYDPSSAEVVGDQLEKLRIDHTCFTFIDFGSGKGRVLLVAARFPFKEVIGVEFSRELHEVALRNIARLGPDVAHAAAVRSVCGDARTFELPPSDLVCYFYNPFGLPVMKEVAARLVAHHERYGFRVIIIYIDPRHPEVFQTSGKFVVVDSRLGALILATNSDAGAGATVVS